MMRVFWSMIVALVPGLVMGAEVTQGQVDELVAQLNAPSAAVRAEALKQLRAAGSQILPWMPEPDATTPPAIRDAITDLRRLFERELAQKSIEPSRVSFSAGELSLETAMQGLGDQTMNPMSVEGLPRRVQLQRFEVRSPESDFWNMVSSIEAALPVQVRWSNAEETFVVQERTEGATVPANASGPARLVVTGSTLRTLENTSRELLLRCEARLQLEPRLRPLFAQSKMADWTASADGKPLKAWNPAADYELSFPDRTSEITLPLDFRWPDMPPRKWFLEGEVTVHLAAGREMLSFSGPTLTRGASQRRGGVSVRVQEARFDNDPDEGLRTRIRIVVNYERGGPAFESHRVGLFHRSAWLTDRDGKQVPAEDFEVTAEVDGGIGIEYRFEKLLGKPVDYSFSYEAPTLLLALPLRFTLRDLPPPSPADE